MVVIIFILLLTVFMIVDFFMKREERQEEKQREHGKSPIFINPINPLVEVGRDEQKYFHPSHSWVLLYKETAYVGYDDFTANLYFPNLHLENIPELGEELYQGDKIWEIGQGERTFTQTSPISGKVLSINTSLYSDKVPSKEGAKSWMLKIKPTNLKRDLQNLITSAKASIINETIFENLLGDVVGAYQNDGGELIDNFIESISNEDWEIIKQKYLN